MTLREFLAQRRLRMDAAAIVAGVNTATISRVASGKRRAEPATVLRLALGFGVSARRMQGICDASWNAAHADAGPPREVAASAPRAAGGGPEAA